jgi:hypothetical protein
MRSRPTAGQFHSAAVLERQRLVIGQTGQWVQQQPRQFFAERIHKQARQHNAAIYERLIWIRPFVRKEGRIFVM